MAADGLSDREIGQKLYLSHRTVESNLYGPFRRSPSRHARSRAWSSRKATPHPAVPHRRTTSLQEVVAPDPDGLDQAEFGGQVRTTCERPECPRVPALDTRLLHRQNELPICRPFREAL